MLGEKNSMMCLYKAANHSFQRQTQNYEDLNKFHVGIPYVILTVFVQTSNLMLIYGLYKTSRPFTIVTKLFIYLSLTDIVLNLVIILYTTSALLYSMSCLAVYLTFTFMQLAYLLGIFIFATISFLRYWSIKKPLHSIETRHLVIALIAQCIVSGLIGAGFLALFNFRVSYEQMTKVNYSIPISQFLAVSFVLIVNTMSYKKLKSMKRMSGFSADNAENTSTQRRKILSEANICLLYITAFYILCPAPLFVITWFGLERLLEYSWGFYLFMATHIFYMSNGGFNSMIVIIRTKNLREFYRVKLCCFPRINGSPKYQNSTELANVKNV